MGRLKIRVHKLEAEMAVLREEINSLKRACRIQRDLIRFLACHNRNEITVVDTIDGGIVAYIYKGKLHEVYLPEIWVQDEVCATYEDSQDTIKICVHVPSDTYSHHMESHYYILDLAQGTVERELTEYDQTQERKRKQAVSEAVQQESPND